MTVYLRLLEPLGIDFPQYYEASLMLLRHLNPYQTLLTSPGPFNYPPTAFFGLSWLGYLPYHMAAAMWNILSLGSFLTSIAIWLRLAGKFTWLKYLITTFFFTVPFFPEKFTLGNGQINNFILLLISLSFWLYIKNRKLVSSLFLALAIGIKLTPAIFLLVPFLLKDFRYLRHVGLWTVLLWVVSPIFVPVQFQMHYFSSVFSQGFSWIGKGVYYNQSLLGMLSRTMPANLIYYPLVIIFVLITIFAHRRDFKSIVAGVTCLGLIISPLSWQHHFVLAIIPLILLKLPKFILVSCFLLLATNSYLEFWGILILWIYSLRAGRGESDSRHRFGNRP